MMKNFYQGWDKGINGKSDSIYLFWWSIALLHLLVQATNIPPKRIIVLITNQRSVMTVERIKESILTCFRETGNVIFPESSGLWTISLHMSLHDLQTEAQATTCFRAGHALSLSSSLLITSRSSSGGRFAHGVSWILVTTTGCSTWQSWTEPRDLPTSLCWLLSLKSKLRLDRLPIPSLTSRTMLRKDISLSLWSWMFWEHKKFGVWFKFWMILNNKAKTLAKGE